MNPTESNNCKIIENLGYEQGCISKEGRALTMHDKKKAPRIKLENQPHKCI